MSVEATVAQDAVRRAAARIAELLHARPAAAAADDDAAVVVVDEFVAACSTLPPGQSAVDLASALGNNSVLFVRRLEAAALHRFQRQLQELHRRRSRSRSDGGGDTMIPRALAELQSAARAWRVSPLVLLTEFAHAPTSDNFWRMLSKLARSSRHGCWSAVRKRLHAARHRRRHDLLARRKGVSHVQPWAIPDLVTVLQEEEEEEEEEEEQEQEQEQVGQYQEEAVKYIGGGQAGAVAKKIAQPAQTHLLDDDDATLPLPRGTKRQRTSSQLSPAALEASGKDGKDGKDGEDGEDSEDGDGNDWTNAIQMRDSEQTSVWRLAYGWWLPSDIVGRLCISIAQIQPNFAVVGVGIPIATPIPPAADTPLRQPETTTLVAPLHIKTPNRWALATLCLPEKVISVYDPLSSRSSSSLPLADADADADTNAAAALERVLATQRSGEATTPTVALALADCAVVVRSCPTQTNSIDSGVAAIALSLYCLTGRAMPQSMDYWLWRRMLAFYLTRLPSDDAAAQTANDVAMAAVFATNHTGLYEHTSTTRPCRRRNTMALRDSAMEGRAIWTAAARLASKVEADARSRRDDMARELPRSRRHAMQLERGSSGLETAVKAAEAHATGIAAVMKGIRAVLDDLDGLLVVLAKQHADQR